MRSYASTDGQKRGTGISERDDKMKIEVMREMAAKLTNDPHFKKRLMDEIMSLPEFRKMLAKMVVKELAD